MKRTVFAKTLLFGLALVAARAGAGEDRDFLFTDGEGHLVLRFANLGPEGLDTLQRDEVVDAQFSTMVHDRIRADILFDAEAPDPRWAAVMEPELETAIGAIRNRFADVDIECRAASCRLLLHQSNHVELNDHLALLAVVQRVVQAFVDAHPGRFEPDFMLAAYDKDRNTPSIKAFLERSASPDRDARPEGG